MIQIKLARHSLRGQTPVEMTPRAARLARLAPARRSVAERRNWGYWDGVTDARNGHEALWNPTATPDHPHPLDLAYGGAYWAGRRGQPHPNRARPL